MFLLIKCLLFDIILEESAVDFCEDICLELIELVLVDGCINEFDWLWLAVIESTYQTIVSQVFLEVGYLLLEHLILI